MLAAGIEDSATALAQKVLSHLMADEAASVIWRDGTPGEIKAAFARALQRRIRNPKPVEVRAYLSENFRGPLLIAEIVRDSGNIVEMVNAPRARSGNELLPLKLSLIWEQEPQILDLALRDDQMYVLDVDNLTSYRRQDGSWHPTETRPTTLMRLRDPRGRIDMTRDPPSIATTLLTPGKNTMSEEGWPAHYSRIEFAGENILAEVDGRVHVYDSNHLPAGTFDGWGSDFALLPSCSSSAILAASASADAVTLYGMANHQPIKMSDPVALPGPITAIWPLTSGALVIAKNVKTVRYEAYSASVDCRN